jgi:hypothetical protein
MLVTDRGKILRDLLNEIGGDDAGIVIDHHRVIRRVDVGGQDPGAAGWRGPGCRGIGDGVVTHSGCIVQAGLGK